MAAGLMVQELATALLGPVSFEAHAGAWAQVVGPSGCGKTLLLRALADLDAHTGLIRLEGRLQSQMPAHQWRRQVQYVATQSGWGEAQVGAHFLVKNDALVARLGFEPDVWHWQPERLSSGEKQRLALARALELSPRVLLLDEAWSHVDPARRDACVGLVQQRVDAGVIAIAVAHETALPEGVQVVARLAGRRQVMA